MGSRQVAFKIVDALPSRVGAIIGTLLTGFAAAYPERIRQWADWIVSPEQIRLFGLGGLALFVAYWGLWIWLRSGGKDEPAPAGLALATHGDGSHNIGVIQTAHFGHVPPTPALVGAAASQTVEILRTIETKYCRKGTTSLLELMRFHENFQNNILIIVGSHWGLTHITREKYDEAQDFFNGGGSILTTHMKNFTPGPMARLNIPPGEVIYVNFCERAGEVMDDLSHLALSPFLPADVTESVDRLKGAVSHIFSEMIVYLNERVQNQPFRLIAAVNDVEVAGGLCNDFMRRAVAVEEPISHLRETIRRRLSNG